MSDKKQLNDEELKKVNGGSLIDEGTAGYYVRYYYYWTTDYQSANKKDGELGPFNNLVTAETVAKDTFLEIKDPSDIRHSYKYQIVLKYEDGYVEEVLNGYVE